MRFAKHVAALAALLSLGSSLRPAAAQDADIAQAKKWFSDGAAAEKKGDCRTAVELFRKALAVKETPQLHLRIGKCQEQLGDLVAAESSYDKAVARAEQGSVKDALDVAREELEDIRPRVPRVTFTLASPPGDLTLTLDGLPLAASSLDTALALNPGDHAVAAEAGKARFDRSFTLAEKDRITIPIELPGSGGAPSTPAPPVGPVTPVEADAGGGPNVPAIALLAGGGAAVIGGVVLVIVSYAKDSSIDDDCGGPERLRCDAGQKGDIESRIDSVNLFRGLGFGLAGAGVIAAGVGATLLVTSSSSSSAAPPAEARAAARRGGVRFSPTVGPGSIGLAAGGRF
ncbi:MAG: tetratricopeptide repeat protein [Polyangiaceae bacterium]